MINIVKRRYWYFAFSLLVIIPGLFSLATNGLRLSISFTSGALLEVRYTDLQGKTLLLDDVRNAFESHGSVGPQVQISGSDTIIVRSKPIDQTTKTTIEKELQNKYGNYTELSFETVGPEVSQEVTKSATYAVAAASLGILLYIIIAFARVDKPYRFGVAAIVAMLHDVLIVLACCSILRWMRCSSRRS